MAKFRHELKYEVTLEDAKRFYKDIEPYCSPDPHVGKTGSYEISSIYYDTKDLRFYLDREESVGYRRKIRLRTYNEDSKAIALFLEIKEKHKQFVYKKRINMKNMDVLSLGIAHDELPLDLVAKYLEDTAEAREIAYLNKRLELFPIIQIRYNRKPVIPNFEQDMRITLDTRITAGGQNMEKYCPDSEKFIINSNHGVLEIKTNQSIPLWLNSIMQHYQFVQTRYSKYCLGVDKIYGGIKGFIPKTTGANSINKDMKDLRFGNDV
jgi:SPX domain protein involved in polyphosphate accumulation